MSDVPARDFASTAKIVVNLIDAKLRCGARDDAIETLRLAFCEANRMGMRIALRSEGAI